MHMGDLQVGGISVHPSNITTPQLHTCFCLQPPKAFKSFGPKVCFSLMVLGLNIFLFTPIWIKTPSTQCFKSFNYRMF